MAYTKHTWTTEELITSDKLNNIENGIDQATFDSDTDLTLGSLTINGKLVSK